MTTLTLDRLYVGEQSCYLGQSTTFGNMGWRKRAFVLGVQFGPMLLAVGCTIEEAFDEWDERYGERVDVEDATLADYPGDTVEERIESAMNDGEIRINSGGTMVWVDHYEWCRGFATVKEAGAFFRGGWR